VHHKHLGPEQGECFGMLLVPWKYVRESMKQGSYPK
jgi:beta-carotene 3-hydroxylase